ncbi:MAG: hypothetical protein ACR2G2_07625 [Pseudonocardia sp.]
MLGRLAERAGSDARADPPVIEDAEPLVDKDFVEVVPQAGPVAGPVAVTDRLYGLGDEPDHRVRAAVGRLLGQECLAKPDALGEPRGHIGGTHRGEQLADLAAGQPGVRGTEDVGDGLDHRG